MQAHERPLELRPDQVVQRTDRETGDAILDALRGCKCRVARNENGWTDFEVVESPGTPDAQPVGKGVGVPARYINARNFSVVG
jgi:hypothetical protein